METKITIQDRILKELFLRNTSMGVEEISDKVKLKPQQVYYAIRSLSARKLVRRTHEKNKASYSVAPFKKVFIQIRDMEYIREMLNAKGLL